MPNVGPNPARAEKQVSTSSLQHKEMDAPQQRWLVAHQETLLAQLNRHTAQQGFPYSPLQLLPASPVNLLSL